MKKKEFKNSPLGKQIIERLEEIKVKYKYRYSSGDILFAIFFSYVSIENYDEKVRYDKQISTLESKTEEQLKDYVRDYDNILKFFLVNYMGVDEGKYLKWSDWKVNKMNMLALSQPCAMLTPTNAQNKDQIH